MNHPQPLGSRTIPHPSRSPRRGGVSPSRKSGPLTPVLTVACMMLGTPLVWAGDLKDVVTDLYGGDGIFLAPPTSGFNHAPHFVASSLESLDNLNAGLVGNVGFASFNSVVSGFTLDLETGEPVRTTDSLGPSLAENATTLGANKLNIGFTFTHSEFTRFEGTPLDNIVLFFDHEDSNDDGVIGPPPPVFDFELDQIRIDMNLEITQDILAIFGTLGISDNWDIGVIVPIIYMSVTAESTASVVDNSDTTDLHFFDTDAGSDSPNWRLHRSKIGIGDVVLRTKYNLLRDRPDAFDMAVSGHVVFPTGDTDNLMGTGETRFQALLVISKAIGWITPHANVGYEWAPKDHQLNSLRYIFGFDVTPHPRVTLATDILGRWEHHGNGIGDHVVDIAVGGKWNFMSSTLFNASLRFPLNQDEGLRADVVWTIGVEHTY